MSYAALFRTAVGPWPVEVPFDDPEVMASGIAISLCEYLRPFGGLEAWSGGFSKDTLRPADREILNRREAEIVQKFLEFQKTNAFLAWQGIEIDHDASTQEQRNGYDASTQIDHDASTQMTMAAIPGMGSRSTDGCA